MGTKADWSKQIENWQRSGLSQAAYCRQQDLPYQYFTAQLAAYRKPAQPGKPAVRLRDNRRSSSRYGNGVWLCQRRLHQGGFVWFQVDTAAFSISQA